MVSRLDAMRDTGRETALHRGRLMVVLLATLLAFGLLIYRYYTLQILEYEQFLTESDRNRVRLEALPPTRGLILDRKGRLLAANEPSRSLGVIVERAGNLGRLMDKIDALVGLDVDDRERFQERRRRSRPYDPVPLKLRLTDQDIAVIGANRHTLPGVTIDAQLTRAYPEGELLSHVVGYVGRINPQEAAALDQEAYRGTFHIGKVGLEKRYESVLLGTVGSQNTEANAHGRTLRVLEQQLPAAGADLQRIPFQTVAVAEGVHLTLLDQPVEVIEVPAHTRHHIAFYLPAGAQEGDSPALFCGDTLFGAGCGRLFEGSAADMHRALQKLGRLPDSTSVHCAHEYTEANLHWAAQQRPEDPNIGTRLQQVRALRLRGESSLPSSIGIEHRTNLFLQAQTPQALADLRQHKDHWKG